MQRVHTYIITGTLLGCILLAIVCLSAVPTLGAAGSDAGSSGNTNPNLGESSPISVEGGTCHVSAQYPDTIRQWCELITQYAEQYNLSPDLIAALIWLESGGNQFAYSKSGAVGLM